MAGLLAGQHVLITGANRGIGLAIAERFAAEGACLYLNGRQPEPLRSLADRLQAEYGVHCHPLVFDVADPDGVKHAFRELFTRTRVLDVLVNNAGILDDALLGMITPELINRSFATNTASVLYCSQYAARMMQRNGGGSIINLASIIGRVGNAGQAVYAGSKAAVIGITQSLAKELAPQQIRVNAIAPGFIDTDMAHSLTAEKFQQRLDSIAMQRIGVPAEVAGTALFLASGLSSYVTGQVIGVDGGMLI